MKKLRPIDNIFRGYVALQERVSFSFKPVFYIALWPHIVFWLCARILFAILIGLNPEMPHTSPMTFFLLGGLFDVPFGWSIYWPFWVVGLLTGLAAMVYNYQRIPPEGLGSPGLQIGDIVGFFWGLLITLFMSIFLPRF